MNFPLQQQVYDGGIPPATRRGAPRRWRCLLGLSLALTGQVGSASPVTARARPLLRDFVGLNAYAAGHGQGTAFDPDLYRPVCRLLREYHKVARDLGDHPGDPTPLPRSRDGTDWSAIYRDWTAKGWDVDASLQFESVAREKWTDLETAARAYGRAYAREFGPSGTRRLVDTVEIGNEPTGWSDEDYTRMFRAMAHGLREGDPRLRIATSNVTTGPSGRWDKSVACVAPFPELYDVLALHLYAEIAQAPTWERSYPENPQLLRYLTDIAALCEWRDTHAPDKAVWVTEFGYDSSTKKADPAGKMPQWIGVTDEQQAQWLVRSILMFAAMPVERAYVYFFNDRDVPSLHASAGITRHLQPKPSFYALAHLQRTLGDYRFGRVVVDEPAQLRVEEFTHEKDPQRTVWVAWSPTGNGAASHRTLPALPGRLVAAERMPLADGTSDAVAAVQRKSDGTIEVAITETPLYLVFEAPRPTAPPAVASVSSPSPMTARELSAWLRSLHHVLEPSVDRVIVGEPDTPVRGIAVAWTPTWAALREAEAAGCNVFVAHEPTFFTHYDLDGFDEDTKKISSAAWQAMSVTRDAKRHWIESHGMVVIRCHDVLDLMAGGVADALAKHLGFSEADYLVNQPYYRVVRVSPAMRAGELAQRLANAFGQLGQPGVAFYGDPERRVEKLGLGTGYACEPWHFVELGAEMCVTIDDRIKTWTETEWADDAGFPMIVIHHGTSEESGVRHLHQLIAAKFSPLPVRLLPQGFRSRWVAPRAERR